MTEPPTTSAANVVPDVRSLRRRVGELAPGMIAVALVTVVVIPRLSPGICFGDSGGLQMAAVTLGITHPPGYAGYVSLGHLFTWLPGVDPAFGVTLACMLSGLCVILLCTLTQLELGVNPWAAAALSLLLTAHVRVWSGLIAPEVYMPSLALVAGAAYLLMRHARIGKNRYLFSAALVFGIALGNRPPVVLALPFFVVGWWLAARARSIPQTRGIRWAVVAALLTAAPSAYSFAYLWLRDRPATAYNYIDEYNAEYGSLPDSAGGAGAKFGRVVWHMSASQFSSNLGVTWSGVRSRLRWLKNRLLPGTIPLAIVSLLVCGGAVLSWRRSQVGCITLAGMGIGSVAFVCAYRVYGAAGDFLPLLYAAAIFAGVVLSPLLPRNGTRPRNVLAGVILALVAGWTLYDAPGRRASNADATHFVKGDRKSVV